MGKIAKQWKAMTASGFRPNMAELNAGRFYLAGREQFVSFRTADGCHRLASDGLVHTDFAFEIDYLIDDEYRISGSPNLTRFGAASMAAKL